MGASDAEGGVENEPASRFRTVLGRRVGPAVRTAAAGGVVALVGFALTRFAVAETATSMAMLDEFLLVATVPLVGGFALATFGVILAVSTFSPPYVRTVATWTVVGTASMICVGVLSTLPSGESFATLTTPPAINAVLAGAVGGTITGVLSAETDVNREELVRKNDELRLLNRMLRDRVLNASAIIDGEAGLAAGGDDPEERIATIRSTTDRIDAAIEEVKVLIESDPIDRVDGATTDLSTALRSAVDRVDAADAPGVRIDGSVPDGCRVDVGDDLSVIVDRFVDLAVARARAPVTARVDGDDTTARLTLAYEGEGLSPAERGVVDSQRIAEFDSPSVEFGLSVVAVLAGRYGGDVEFDDGPPRSLTLSLPRAGGTPTWSSSRVGQTGLRPDQLRNIGVASAVAGVAMGGIMASFTGLIPVIGSLYGVSNAAIGWLSHVFHSLVFGLTAVAVLERSPLSDARRFAPRRLGYGVVVGVALSLVAAGVVMPLWLRLLGTATPVPNVSLVGLVGHVVWGGLLILVYDALPGGVE